MIEIDGSYLEGGGQILRTAVAFSTVTKKPCHIFNIRVKRSKPGLMPQHLLGIQALAQFCNGRLEGDSLGSKEIKFYPGETYRDQVFVDIPTAGSITLVLQTLIPPALLAPKPVKISFNGGATDTFFAPVIDHFYFVFLKILEKIGGRVEVNILRRGYYPEGGAKVVILIQSWQVKLTQWKLINLIEKGLFKKILVISGASNVLKEKKVAERQIAGAREILGKLKLPVQEKVEYYDTCSPGSQICLIAQFENAIIGTDNLGKLGKRAEEVGREAALELLKEQKSGACLDKYLADQLLPYMALTGKKSKVSVSEITPHVQTNIWVIEKFLEGNFEINPHAKFGMEARGNLISWKPA